MSTHESRIGGNLCVSVSENRPHNRLADASVEVVVRALKAPSDQAGASPWNPYVIARLDLLVRRNAAEFPNGELLNEEAETAVLGVVRDFLARNRTAEQQPAATPPKAPETAAAGQ